MPTSPQEARQEVVNALARAGLGDWTVPELSEASNTQYADGSVRITLLAHAILINPSGAFRIIDLHAPREPYFEMQGKGDRAFVLPLDKF